MIERQREMLSYLNCMINVEKPLSSLSEHFKGFLTVLIHPPWSLSEKLNLNLPHSLTDFQESLQHYPAGTCHWPSSDSSDRNTQAMSSCKTTQEIRVCEALQSSFSALLASLLLRTQRFFLSL